MQITNHIDVLLQGWARWLRARHDGGALYTGLSRSAECHYDPERLAGGWSQMFAPFPVGGKEERDAIDVHRAVVRLDAILLAVVEEAYLQPGSADDHAEALRLTRRTYYRRREDALLKVMYWLNEHAADPQSFPRWLRARIERTASCVNGTVLV